LNAPAGVDRPLSLGEIVDRSVTIAVRRWWVLLVLVLIEAIPIGIARTFEGDGPHANYWWLAVDFLIAPWLYCAAVLTTASPEVPSVATVLRRSLARYRSCLAAAVLAVVLALFVGIPAAFALVVAVVSVSALGPTAAGAAGAIAGGAVVLWLAPRLILVGTLLYPIVALENASAGQAWSIAFRRTRNAGNMRSWLFGLALFALGLVPSLIIGFGLDQLVDLTHVSAFRFVEELLSDALSVGFGSVVATVMSLEMRVRDEGADIEAAIARSGSGYQENGAPSSAAISSAGSE
jgi:hypothetical protein